MIRMSTRLRSQRLLSLRVKDQCLRLMETGLLENKPLVCQL